MKNTKNFLLLGLIFISASGYSNKVTLEEIQNLIDKKDYKTAVSHAEEYLHSFDSSARGKAAVLALRSLINDNNAELLKENLDKYLAAAISTPFESQFKFEQAKATHMVFNELDLASQLYNEIILRFPNELFIASGSMFYRAEIEMQKANYELAKNTLTLLVKNHPNSPFADDALVKLCQIYSKLLELNDLNSTTQILKDQYPDSAVLHQALLIQADFINNQAGDSLKALTLYHEIAKKWPKSSVEAVARIRINDNVRNGNFLNAISDYYKILEEYPTLPGNQRSWCLVQIGIYYYQLEMIEESKKVFESLQVDALPTYLKDKVYLHLAAIKNPHSPEGLKAIYDRGIRWRFNGGTRDLCWKAFYDFKKISESPFFQSYCNDSSIPKEERAQMMYRLNLVKWELGDHGNVCGDCDFILEKYQPIGVTRYQCLYMKAYHHAHCGHHELAGEMFKEFIDENSDIASLVPRAYRELARMYEMQNDLLGAALTLEEFKILYPYRTEAKEMSDQLNWVLKKGGKDLIAQYEIKKKDLLAKFKNIKPPALEESPAKFKKDNQIATVVQGGLK